MLCDMYCSEPGFCRGCCCILCFKTISSDYDGYNYIQCEAIVDGYICGHVSHLDCALRSYMAGKVGGSINLDAQYLCRYCDSRMDLVPHALKLIKTCTSVASRAAIEIFLNVGICILRGSQKRNGKELLHHIKSIKSKLMKGVCIQDAFKKEGFLDSIGECKELGPHYRFSKNTLSSFTIRFLFKPFDSYWEFRLKWVPRTNK
ncbi:protein OBERON 2-like [Solanum pennellii]|uniref:Protein OBERON 2-like n=1 Tax=Solanum pennellii TaxID=28526 RepID=A0ABM1UWB2_SOLPN|nr:protein OBERON 2-like [Solanum pennellii]